MIVVAYWIMDRHYVLTNSTMLILSATPGGQYQKCAFELSGALNGHFQRTAYRIDPKKPLPPKKPYSGRYLFAPVETDGSQANINAIEQKSASSLLDSESLNGLDQNGNRERYLANVELDQFVEEARRRRFHHALAIVQDGLAPTPLKRTRAVMPLYDSVLHIIARPEIDSIDSLRTLQDRIYLGRPGSGTRQVAEFILNNYGISIRRSEEAQRSTDTFSFDQAADALADPEGKIDVAFFLCGYDCEAVRTLIKAAGHDTPVGDRLRLLSIGMADEIAAKYPFLRATSIPPGMYQANNDGTNGFPMQPVRTISSRAILVASTETPPKKVRGVLDSIYDIYDKIHLDLDDPLLPRVRQSDPQSGFFTPIHPGAEEFYSGTGKISWAEIWRMGVGLFAVAVAQVTYFRSFVHIRPIRSRINQIDTAVEEHATDPTALDLALSQIKDDAAIQYSKGKISREGLQQIREYADVQLKKFSQEAVET